VSCIVVSAMPTNGMASIFGDAVCRCYRPFVETILRGDLRKQLGAKAQLIMVRLLEDAHTFVGVPTVLCSCNLEQLET
jgi:hypothetical protein